jgi:hypothetical protein
MVDKPRNNEGTPMTKLEELEAEYGAAWEAYWVALDAGHEVAAWAVVEHAYAGYMDELNKPEETSDEWA